MGCTSNNFFPVCFSICLFSSLWSFLAIHLFLKFKITLIYCVYLYVCACMHMCTCAGVIMLVWGLEDNFQQLICVPSIRTPEIRLRLPDLAANTFSR